MKLLEIQSSPRGESSGSISLTKSFIEACKSDNTSIVVDTLNVWHERLPEFDYEAIGAKYKAVKHETMTEAESNVWERIQSLIQRLPLLLHRLIFCEDKLPERLAPSLAIFVASPAVGCLSWVQLTGRMDAVYRFILFTALFFALLVAACGASTSCIGRLVGLHLSQCGARFCSDSLLPACARGWRETSSVGRSHIDHDHCSRRGAHFIEKLLAEIVAFGSEPAWGRLQKGKVPYACI